MKVWHCLSNLIFSGLKPKRKWVRWKSCNTTLLLHISCYVLSIEFVGEGTDLFEIIASHTKIKSNKDGEKGRQSIHPQGLLPQIHEMTCKRLAQVIRLELKASLSLLLMTWTLHAGSVKGRKENYITICTNTHAPINLNSNYLCWMRKLLHTFYNISELTSVFNVLLGGK